MTGKDSEKNVRFDMNKNNRDKGRGRYLGHRQDEFTEEEGPSTWENNVSEIGFEGSTESKVACHVTLARFGAHISSPNKKLIHLKLMLGRLMLRHHWLGAQPIIS